MCMATAIFEEKLGKRREGWCVYLNQSKEFTWLSDKQVKGKINSGEKINGLLVDADGNVAMDKSFTTGLLAKTGLATFIPIDEDSTETFAKYLAVTKAIKEGKSTRYEVVSNRFKVEIIEEERLKALLSLLSVGGVQLDEKGKVVLHEAVEVETVLVEENMNK